MTELTFAVPDAGSMKSLGQRLGSVLVAGDLVILSGPLGAGKTTLAQGIGAGLGVQGPVTSPTFVIARVHGSLGAGPDLIHVDAYRLRSVAEVDELDLESSMEASVTLVEWGEGKVDGLTERPIQVVIERDREPRMVRVSFPNERSVPAH